MLNSRLSSNSLDCENFFESMKFSEVEARFEKVCFTLLENLTFILNFFVPSNIADSEYSFVKRKSDEIEKSNVLAKSLVLANSAEENNSWLDEKSID